MSLINGNFKFDGSQNVTISDWVPEYWHRRLIRGEFYTYQAEKGEENEEEKEAGNCHGIKLYASGSGYGGLGSVFQVRELSEGVYSLEGMFRSTVAGIGASMFIIGYDEDEESIVNENCDGVPTYDMPVQNKKLYKKYFPITDLIPNTPINAELHVPKGQEICKVGVIAGYGAGQSIIIDSLSLKKVSDNSDFPYYQSSKVEDAGCFYIAKLVNNRTSLLISAKVENKGSKDICVYAAHNEILISDFRKNETWFPGTLGWRNMIVPSGKTVWIFQKIPQAIPANIPIPDIAYTTITLYTNRGILNANHPIN